MYFETEGEKRKEGLCVRINLLVFFIFFCFLNSLKKLKSD